LKLTFVVAVRHLRTLLHVVLTNSEARKLLSDFSVIGRDLLSKTAGKAAEMLAPDEERLRRADETAPNDQFITEGGRPAGPGETPVLEARIPGTDKTIKRHPDDEHAQIRNEDGTHRPLPDLRDEGKQRIRELQEQGRSTGEEAQDQARQHAEDIRTSDAPGDEAEAKKNGFRGKMREMRVRVFRLA